MPELRVIRAPSDCLGLTLPWSDKPLRVGPLLFKLGSGLARVKFTPPEDLRQIVRAPKGVQIYAAQWIEKCCDAWDVGRSWLVTILQSEQNAITGTKILNPNWTTRHIAGPKANLWPGEKILRTKAKAGYLAVKGSWKAMAIAGYAIPDPGARPHFTTELYLGLPRQIFYAARWLRIKEDQFSRLERQGKLPKVTLYGKKGQKPEKVLCADRFAFKVLEYTPNEKEIPHRARVNRDLAKRGGQLWVQS